MKKILLSIIDSTAWLLILPALVILALIDLPMLLTLLSWTGYLFVMIGLCIIVSRLAFPQIRLGELVESARAGNSAAGIVAAALIVFFGLLLLAFVLWSK